ncbi:LysR family transcriptional regulator [Sulfitobacter sp. F26204]|uniref:LysR family transcriptional regulator n=1 Tax=Sulfitobacter sp. F26204 TaxID=2996014 RepID=UPI00225E4851|nr:LysR family transcriptional regulator [Sulfitobacter sp. F26204]MCX7560707.1 LysR family transcriptional regulator [Sulfitobacter sp. F26204]
MDRLNLDDAPAFLAIARTGTLTAAAKLLGVGIATISRRIERLEHALSVPLFVRHQSGYKLTDEGQALLPRAEALEEAAQSFRADAAFEAEATGHVRLATAENLANQFIIPSLPELLEANPGLSIEVLTDIATSNLHRRDADLAVRMVRPERGNLTVRQIGILGYGLYGSRSFPQAPKANAEATQMPGNPISRDRYVGWSERQQMLPAAQWIERQLKGDAPAIVTTSLLGQVSAAKAGLGLSVLPHFIAADAGLKAVKKDVGLDQPIWLVVHSDLAASRRVKVVADHVVAVINRHSDQLQGLIKTAP